jgi:hypothetical protein
MTVNYPRWNRGTVNRSKSLCTGTAAGGLSTSAGSTINIGAGAHATYNGATLGGLVAITRSTTFESNSAAITLSGTVAATCAYGTVSFASLSGAGTPRHMSKRSAAWDSPG